MAATSNEVTNNVRRVLVLAGRSVKIHALGGGARTVAGVDVAFAVVATTGGGEETGFVTGAAVAVAADHWFLFYRRSSCSDIRENRGTRDRR